MARNPLPNELLGGLYRRVGGIIDKIENGGLEYQPVMSQLQAIFEDRVELAVKKVEAMVVSTLTFVKTITTPSVAGKKTSDCFRGESRYYGRAPELDKFLLKYQSEQPESKFSVTKLTLVTTFKQVVGSFLGVGDIKTLSRILKESGYITTLPVIESLIERQEAGEDVGLTTRICANFFFVEDYSGSVSVVSVRRDGTWVVDVFRLDYDHFWEVNDRFFFRIPKETIL